MIRRLIPFILALIPAIVSAAWLSGYSYRKGATIDAKTGAGTNYPIKVILDFDSAPSVKAVGDEICHNDLFIYDIDGDSIIMEHDLLNDTAGNAVKACTSEYGPDFNSWSGAGGGSLIKEGSTYYLACRQKGDDTERGIEWQMWSSTNLSTWAKDWSVLRTNVTNPPFTIQSLEDVSLNKFGSDFYLYVCVLNSATQQWYVYYVKSNTIATLDDSLTDGTKWHQIGSWLKDPEVFEYNGNYYLCCQVDTNFNANQPALFESSSPTFSSKTLIGTPGMAYEVAYNPDWNHPGVILYDDSSNYFIYWGQAFTDIPNDTYWYWTVSTNLKQWELVDRKHVDEYAGECAGNARYVTVWCVNDDDVVVGVEWDEDENDRSDYWIWDYTDDAGGSTDSITLSGVGNRVYLDQNVQGDFDDVRITDGDSSTQLFSHIEAKADSDTAAIWCEVTDDLSSANQSIVVYYGNVAATESSAADSIFFGHWNFAGLADGADPGADWDSINEADGYHEVDVDQSVSAGRSLLIEQTTATNPFVSEVDIPDITTNEDRCVEFSIRPDATARVLHVGTGSQEGDGGFTYWNVHCRFQSDQMFEDYNAGAWNEEVGYWDDDRWYKVRYYDFNFTSNNFLFDFEYFYKRRTPKAPFRVNTDTLKIVHFKCAAQALKWKGWIDNVFVRKWNDPEPRIIAWGAEETAPLAGGVIIID